MNCGRPGEGYFEPWKISFRRMDRASAHNGSCENRADAELGRASRKLFASIHRTEGLSLEIGECFRRRGTPGSEVTGWLALDEDC